MPIHNHQRDAAPAHDATLDTADAVARAAHIWIRSLCLTQMQEPAERHAMACGLIAGLCSRLELDARVRELVAYVYALIDDEGAQALSTSRMMFVDKIPAEHLHAYRKGQSEAAAIVEMLAYLGPKPEADAESFSHQNKVTTSQRSRYVE
jgi:hypothetical protein